MKKVVLVTVLTVLGLVNIQAQDIEFGAKAGLNFAAIYGDNTEDVGPVTAFNFGVMAEIPIAEKFSFQPELLFSGQGYDIENTTVALSYLSLPLMGKYYLTKGLSLEAGPQLGLLLSAKAGDLDVKDSFNTLDYGVNAGIGYKLDNGLNFGARYNVGLSDINNVEGFSDSYKNGVLQISVGYFFF